MLNKCLTETLYRCTFERNKQIFDQSSDLRTTNGLYNGCGLFPIPYNKDKTPKMCDCGVCNVVLKI